MIEYFVLNFQTFMMIFARLFGLFAIAPVFSMDSVRGPVRVMLAFVIALILFPVTAGYMPMVPGNMPIYGMILLMELLIGILIGFLVHFMFAAFQMAGEFFNVQLGFGYTEVLDPVTQSSLPVISNLKNLFGILIFLITGGHRIMIESLAYSYEHIRMYDLDSVYNDGLFRTMEGMVGAMFVVAFKISFPVLGILFLVTVAEALMGKAAPQLNILQLSFPIKIIIGLIILFAIMPFIEEQIEQSFSIAFDKINKMINEWPGANGTI